jgi:hypothetical protein
MARAVPPDVYEELPDLSRVAGEGRETTYVIMISESEMSGATIQSVFPSRVLCAQAWEWHTRRDD